eukprot:358929-Chlamydomonas_euryale.AAC.4
MGRLEITHSNRLRRIVGVKLTDRHRLETIREKCGMSSLELMVRRRTLQWTGHVLRMDEHCLPHQVFDCSLARSVAEDGRVERLKTGSQKYERHFLGCTALQSRGSMRKVLGGGTTLGAFLKLRGHTELIPWPEIRAAAARIAAAPWLGQAGLAGRY